MDVYEKLFLAVFSWIALDLKFELFPLLCYQRCIHDALMPQNTENTLSDSQRKCDAVAPSAVLPEPY